MAYLVNLGQMMMIALSQAGVEDRPRVHALPLLPAQSSGLLLWGTLPPSLLLAVVRPKGPAPEPLPVFTRSILVLR